MADMRIVYSEIEALKGTVDNLLAKYNDSITGVIALQSTISNGGVLGPVGDTLHEKLNTIAGNMKNYASVMSQLSAALQKAAQELQAKDQETSGKIPQK